MEGDGPRCGGYPSIGSSSPHNGRPTPERRLGSHRLGDHHQRRLLRGRARASFLPGDVDRLTSSDRGTRALGRGFETVRDRFLRPRLSERGRGLDRRTRRGQLPAVGCRAGPVDLLAAVEQLRSGGDGIGDAGHEEDPESDEEDRLSSRSDSTLVPDSDPRGVSIDPGSSERPA